MFSPKNTILTSLLVVSSVFSANAQSRALTIESYLSKAGDHSVLFQGRIEPPFNYSQWVSQPFWEDKEIHEGSISFNGIYYPHVSIGWDNSPRFGKSAVVRNNTPENFQKAL